MIHSQTRKMITAGHAAVGLAVGAEVRDVEREHRGGDDPQHDGEEAAGADPPVAGLLDVRRHPVEEREDLADDQRDHRPLHDVEHRHRRVADAEDVADPLRPPAR